MWEFRISFWVYMYMEEIVVSPSEGISLKDALCTCCKVLVDVIARGPTFYSCWRFSISFHFLIGRLSCLNPQRIWDSYHSKLPVEKVPLKDSSARGGGSHKKWSSQLAYGFSQRPLLCGLHPSLMRGVTI